MLKITFYIAAGLALVFGAVFFAWKYLGKKRKVALRRLESENPRYIGLEKEKTAIKQKREELETEHPFQKLLAEKIKLKKARAAGNKTAIAEYEAAIERILEQQGVNEDKLTMAYHAQLDAMNHRLMQIELEQRQMRLEAKSIMNLISISGELDEKK